MSKKDEHILASQMGALMTAAKWNKYLHPRGWTGGTETKTREMKLLRDDVGVPSETEFWRFRVIFRGLNASKDSGEFSGGWWWKMSSRSWWTFFFHTKETCLDLLFMDLMPFEKDLFVQHTNTQKSIQTYPDGMLRMATWTRNHV